MSGTFSPLTYIGASLIHVGDGVYVDSAHDHGSGATPRTFKIIRLKTLPDGRSQWGYSTKDPVNVVVDGDNVEETVEIQVLMKAGPHVSSTHTDTVLDAISTTVTSDMNRLVSIGAS